MPIKTIRNQDPKRLIVLAFLAGFMAMIANAAAISIFVSRTDEARKEGDRQATAARVANCEAVQDAFDLYTDVLIATFDEATDRTPEEQAEFDQIASEFRDDINNALRECR